VCRTVVGRACGDKDDGRIGGTHRSFNTFCQASEASFNVWMRAAIWARRRKWSGTCSQCNVPQCLSIARNRRRKLLRCVPRRCYFYFLVLSNLVSCASHKSGKQRSSSHRWLGHSTRPKESSVKMTRAWHGIATNNPVPCFTVFLLCSILFSSSCQPQWPLQNLL
jgi:hypothetical protein